MSGDSMSTIKTFITHKPIKQYISSDIHIPCYAS